MAQEDYGVGEELPKANSKLFQGVRVDDGGTPRMVAQEGVNLTTVNGKRVANAKVQVGSELGLGAAVGGSTDAAAEGDSNGTTNAHLRGLNKILGAVSDAAVAAGSGSIGGRLRSIMDFLSSSFGSSADGWETDAAANTTLMAYIRGILMKLPVEVGRTPATASFPVVISDEDKAALDAIQTAVQTLDNAIAGSEMQVDIVSSAAIPITDNGGSLTVDGTVSVTGVATAANQATANTSLAAIDTKLGASLPLPTGASTAANQTTANTSLSAIDTKIGDISKAEDAAHSSGDKGIQALAVRKDTAAALAGTDGDYTPLIVDASGRLWINVGTSVLPTGAATEATLTAQSAKLPATLGQKTMANSFAVTIASDQSSIVVQPTQTEHKSTPVRIVGDDANHVIIGAERLNITSMNEMRQVTPNTNRGTQDNAGAGGLNTNLYHTLIGMPDLSGFSGMTILSAKLMLYNMDFSEATNPSATGPIQVHRILPANSGWTETDATWTYKSASGTTAWAGSAGCSTSGTDYSSTVMGSATYTTYNTSSNPYWSEFDLDVTEFTAMVADNHGLLMRANIESGASGSRAHFRTDDYADPDFRPYLLVTVVPEELVGVDVDLVTGIAVQAIGSEAWYANDIEATENDFHLPNDQIVTLKLNTNGVPAFSVLANTGTDVVYSFTGSVE